MGLYFHLNFLMHSGIPAVIPKGIVWIRVLLPYRGSSLPYGLIQESQVQNLSAPLR